MKDKIGREGKLKIGIASVCAVPGDVDGNLHQIEEAAYEAGCSRCDVLLTPEMSACGYGSYKEVLDTAEEAGKGPIYRRLAHMAEYFDLAIMAGFVERNGGRKHISHYIVFNDGSYLVQRKHRVTPSEFPLDPAAELYYDATEEIGHVAPGQVQFTYFTINRVKCALAICADVGIRDLNPMLKRDGVRMLFVPVGAGGDREHKITSGELRTREGIQKYYNLCNNEYFFPGQTILDCIHYQRGNAVVNMCGYDGRRLYHGGSGSVISHFGEIVGYLAGTEILDIQRMKFACGEIDFTKNW